MGIKVLIVEDEILVAEDISSELEDNGFIITGIAISFDECIKSIENETPNIVLLDINIKGNKDGIETARVINEKYNIPIIFLTANSDSATVKMALETIPSAFISKPYNNKDLIIALEIAFNKHNKSVFNLHSKTDKEYFFVKSGDLYKKINTTDINYIEADGSYCSIHTDNKSYTISSNLNCFDSKLNNSLFARIHRSYIVNINKVEAFDRKSIIINGKTLPISKSQQKEILSLFTKL